jgi:hypothetical protein
VILEKKCVVKIWNGYDPMMSLRACEHGDEPSEFRKGRDIFK